MSQVDSVTLGEGASVVADCDAVLYASAKEVLEAKTQNLIFEIICIGNVKVIPTFRINFLNFPWQLLGASGPAGFTRLSCIVT